MSGASSRRKFAAAISSPCQSSITTVPPIAAESARATSRRPRCSSTSCSSRRCTAIPRCSTSYCSFTRCANALSVIAMNGISYGTSNSGKPRRSASSTTAGGMSSCSIPVPNPRPARWWSTSMRTKTRCCSSSCSWMPVVRSSSPPDIHGVGSSSSLMCTQRMGDSVASLPATGESPSSSIRLSTVSSMSPPYGPTPRSARVARRTRSPRTAPARRSAAGRAGSRGRRGRLSGRSARGCRARPTGSRAAASPTRRRLKVSFVSLSFTSSIARK